MPKNEEPNQSGAEGDELEPTNEPAEGEENVESKPAKTELNGKHEPANEPAKLQLTEAELNERIAAGIKAQKDAEAEAARVAEAEAQGNYKQLLDDAQARLRKAELTSWRSKAILKHGLPTKVFDYLNGETEEEIMAAAKQLKAVFEANAAAAIENSTDDSLPYRDSHRREHRGHERSGEDKTLAGMQQIFPLRLNLENFPKSNN